MIDWSALGTGVGAIGAGILTVGVAAKKSGLWEMIKRVHGCPDKECQTTLIQAIVVLERVEQRVGQIDDKVAGIAEGLSYLKGKLE
jgi:hypothetical protein